jgi:hypothetical protein
MTAHTDVNSSANSGQANGYAVDGVNGHAKERINGDNHAPGYLSVSGNRITLEGKAIVLKGPDDRLYLKDDLLTL